MKVKIGAYPTHRWFNDWLYKYFGYSPKQRRFVRIDKYDTWSMDKTLSYIILPMLKQLKETTHGAPEVDNIDVPSELASQHEIFGRHFQKWEYVLDEMIFAFESKTEEFVSLYPLKTSQSRHVRMENGFRLFGKYYQHLWD